MGPTRIGVSTALITTVIGVLTLNETTRIGVPAHLLNTYLGAHTPG